MSVLPPAAAHPAYLSLSFVSHIALSSSLATRRGSANGKGGAGLVPKSGGSANANNGSVASAPGSRRSPRARAAGNGGF